MATKLEQRLRKQMRDVAATSAGATPRSDAEMKICVSAISKLVALSQDATSADRLMPPSAAIVLIL
jgi:hypothetical protein